MKKKEVKKGLIVSLHGMPSNVRIESDNANWRSRSIGRPVQCDRSRGVLVRYVDHNGKPRTNVRFVTTLQNLKLIPDAVKENPPTIAGLAQKIKNLEDKIKVLETRTLVYVKCDSCDGRGTDGDYYHPGKCEKCAGYGQIQALCPLEEE